MIIKKNPAHEITAMALGSGKFTSMKDNASGKLVEGLTTLEEAASAVMF